MHNTTIRLEELAYLCSGWIKNHHEVDGVFGELPNDVPIGCLIRVDFQHKCAVVIIGEDFRYRFQLLVITSQDNGALQSAVYRHMQTLDIELSANEKSQALVLGGRPLNEPVAWGGPFVMNTREEVVEAYRDFQAGRMGTIPAEIVRA